MTAEHAYQAAKFDDRAIKTEIANAGSPYQAKMIAKKHDDKVRGAWWDVNVSIMKNILEAKLSSHEYIQQKRKASRDKTLIENTNDAFWGRGPDGDGENKLGKLWMELREKL